MKKAIITIFFSIILIVKLSTGISYAQYNQKELVCGIIVTHMAVSPSGILEGIRPFAKYMTNRIGVNVRAEVISDTDVMLTKLKDGSIHLGYVSNLDYIKIKEKLNITPFVKVVKGGTSTYNANLLVRADSGINGIADLKGKTLAYSSKNSSHGYLFPSLLTKTRFNSSLENFFSDTIKTKKDPDGIFAVLYKKADAEGASSQTFLIMSDLMPRLKRELKYIEQSEPFVHGPMFYYEPNFKDKKLIQRCIEEVKNMEKSTEGKQILLLFKIGGWTTSTDSDYNSLRNLLKKI